MSLAQSFGSVFIWYGSESRILSWILIRIHSGSRDFMTQIWKYLQLKKNLIFFGSKITIYISLGLHIGRPNYERSLQLFPNTHPNPDPLTWLNSDSIRIRNPGLILLGGKTLTSSSRGAGRPDQTSASQGARRWVSWVLFSELWQAGRTKRTVDPLVSMARCRTSSWPGAKKKIQIPGSCVRVLDLLPHSYRYT